MIWEFITRKKCQRQLQLLEWIQYSRYSVTELAEKMTVSRKTISRDIEELRQKNFLIKEKIWQINWQSEPNYLGLCRKLIRADPRFQLFRGYLWNDGDTKSSYSKLRRLNKQILHLNISVNHRSGELAGEPALIVLLQLRYLRDFYSFEEQEMYDQLAHYYLNRSLPSIEKAAFFAGEQLEDFRSQFGVESPLAEYFYFDYLRHHFDNYLDLYRSHQQQRSSLYQEVQEACAIIEEVFIEESGTTEELLAAKLFDLFLGVYQGLPLTLFNLKWRGDTVSDHFYIIAKEFKRRLPFLTNCQLDELAFALKEIFSSVHSASLTLTPNLKSSLLIQERYQAYDTSPRRN
ncbi:MULTISPECIES: HTH domain-containing protein [unclassified Enterococcus]|uniref:HTH domain-containing protein n=1 Tax=unclassified Enterococcus TaxID=2608891 RepID=UPI000A3306AB|nr:MULTISPECIES: HTH domain-containing protein [unclassified Enterococcus]OTO76414.1 hypothetical protein A5865_000268 [Enterococcus sp. 12E11_DIV0728]OUZ17423.1 hypothetical protein A5868_002366 [Enterococcus sp. 12F9_DIV0723]